MTDPLGGERDRHRTPEIDARFLLANERTLLAWIRTGLALLAGGAGIAQFGSRVSGRTAFAVALAVVGVAAVAVGALRYLSADRAIRRGALPGSTTAPLVVAGIVAGLGAVLIVAVLV